MILSYGYWRRIKMEKWKNKWTGKLFSVVKYTDKSVTLHQEDTGREFTIQISELHFSYKKC